MAKKNWTARLFKEFLTNRFLQIYALSFRIKNTDRRLVKNPINVYDMIYGK
jgi:hypothetical protein